MKGEAGPGENPAGSSSSFSPHPSSFSRWRNAILGTLLVLAGLAAAAITLFARNTDNYLLAATAAVMSLVSAVLMLIFIVPPLARSARLEVKHVGFPIEITSGGGIFTIILAVVGFAAWNQQQSALHDFLTAVLHRVRRRSGGATSLRDLIVSARFPDHIFAGEAAPVIVTLRNATRAAVVFDSRRGPRASRSGQGARPRR